MSGLSEPIRLPFLCAFVGSTLSQHRNGLCLAKLLTVVSLLSLSSPKALQSQLSVLLTHTQTHRLPAKMANGSQGMRFRFRFCCSLARTLVSRWPFSICARIVETATATAFEYEFDLLPNSLSFSFSYS